jgi:ADP-ribosyl-[dinitrogen reductase] hydrolase
MAADTPDRPLPNSYWVLPGEFLAGEHPLAGVGSPMAALERLRELMDAGIDCFIDLTMSDELEAYEHELPAGVQYLRRPIRDHGLPARREHMIEILTDLERSLSAGRRVYVHCRAGIGRTGTVVGCFLIERGETGDSALNALNRLWQQCARSASWSYVPETEDQVEFVRAWKPVLNLSTAPAPAASAVATKGKKKSPSAIKVSSPPVARPVAAKSSGPQRSTSRGLRDRYEGALLGLAIGDALAVATQGLKSGSFAPVNDLLGGGALNLPAGAWTDDTAMALCLAESLVDREGFDVRDQVERYTRWQKEGYLSATGVCVGITPNTTRALGAAQWRRQVFAGSHDPNQLDPEVLSRAAPAVLFAFGSPEESLRIACDAARITCQAPLALEACQVLAALLYGALADEPKEGVLNPNPAVLQVESLRAKVAGLLSNDPASLAKTPRAGGSIVDVLGAALWAFQTTDNFHDGALRAANLGGHSDAIAATYGQLAGAFYGAQAIPAGWRNALAGKALITDFAARLLAHAQRRLS